MTTSTKTPRDAFQGILWMLAACFLWAMIEKIGGSVPPEYSAYQIVWFRYAIHLTALCLILWPTRRINLVRTQRPLIQTVRSLLMLVMPVCFVGGISRLESDTLWSLFWISPLMAMGAGRLALGESLDVAKWGASIAGMAGALLILAPHNFPGSPLALMFPAGMAVSYTAYQFMTRKYPDESTEANLFYTALCVLLALTVFLPKYWRPMTMEAARPMIAIGIIGLAFLLALDRALHLAPLSVVAPVGYTQIIWSHLVFKGGTNGLGRAAMLSGVVLIIGSAFLLICNQWGTLDLQHGKGGPQR